jgi:hypothetical protein
MPLDAVTAWAQCCSARRRSSGPSKPTAGGRSGSNRGPPLKRAAANAQIRACAASARHDCFRPHAHAGRAIAMARGCRVNERRCVNLIMRFRADVGFSARTMLIHRDISRFRHIVRAVNGHTVVVASSVPPLPSFRGTQRTLPLSTFANRARLVGLLRQPRDQAPARTRGRSRSLACDLSSYVPRVSSARRFLRPRVRCLTD